MKIRTLYKKNLNDLSGAMTDISFLLIIFFLIAAVFMTEYGLDLIFPDKEPETVEITDVLYIDIIETGNYMINNELISSDFIETVIYEKLNQAKPKTIIINAASGIKYQEVLSVLETAKLSGGTSFSITSQNKNPVPIKITEGQ